MHGRREKREVLLNRIRGWDVQMSIFVCACLVYCLDDAHCDGAVGALVGCLWWGVGVEESYM